MFKKLLGLVFSSLMLNASLALADEYNIEHKLKQLYTGMSKEQVLKIMGEPDKHEEQYNTAKWEYSKYYHILTFTNDLLVFINFDQQKFNSHSEFERLRTENTQMKIVIEQYGKANQELTEQLSAANAKLKELQRIQHITEQNLYNANLRNQRAEQDLYSAKSHNQRLEHKLDGLKK